MKKPLYKQVYDDLFKKIHEGFYSEDSELPSVLELEEIYETSQITIRRALNELKSEKLIDMSRGKKARVLPRRRTAALKGIYGTTQEISLQGGIASSPILKFEDGFDAPPWISDLTDNSELYYLKRLRKRDNDIIGVTEQFILKNNGYKLSIGDLGEKVSIYESYRNQGFVIKHTDETIEVEMPTTEMSKLLGIDIQIPLFKRTRTTYDENDEILEISVNYFRSDMYQYFVQINY